MSKIQLIEYSYQDHQVGDVVDLGEIKNTSMVGLGRAVWIDNTPTPPKKPSKKVVAEIEPIKNMLQEQVEQAKKTSPKNSFWANLK